MKKITYLFFATMLLTSVQFISAQCFTPLYPTATNLCPDPEMTDLALWNGWGAGREVVTGSGAYCGSNYMKLVSDGNATGCTFPGNNGEDSALDINIIWEPNATYRLHVWVKTVGGSIGFLVNAGDPNVGISYDTAGAWQLIDETFTTGSGAGEGFISFNTCDSDANATEIHIDNYELYRIDTLGLDGKLSTVSSNVRAIGNRIYISNVKTSTEVQVYSLTGALVKSFKTTNDTDFNFKSGLYIATIKTFEGQKSVKLIVK
ncbi:T9SS type A sorting domain-containing protein [Thalassobellus suaedae]|uniref:T9SS type A sorting domain-containing protein n=1 Tax=Thalassobellus suaedae TaxID=3074124 RepID=A0ABY9XXA1_9FLAO|nr:T9SS type A sorting domain-containing protein [Flavobacteriaceae bacterium HL-DH14]